MPWRPRRLGLPGNRDARRDGGHDAGGVPGSPGAVGPRLRALLLRRSGAPLPVPLGVRAPAAAAAGRGTGGGQRRRWCGGEVAAQDGRVGAVDGAQRRLRLARRGSHAGAGDESRFVGHDVDGGGRRFLPPVRLQACDHFLLRNGYLQTQAVVAQARPDGITNNVEKRSLMFNLVININLIAIISEFPIHIYYDFPRESECGISPFTVFIN